jgi:uncharacterized membrane protein YphA (DoxX/SURF4 family)
MDTISPVLHWSVGLSLGLLWVTAAWSKLRDRGGLQQTLVSYQLLPPCLAPTLSRLLPCLEMLIGLGLLLPATRSIAALTTTALLLVYGLAMAINLLRGRFELECGCNPGTDQLISWSLVLRNVVLGAASLMLLLPFARRPLQLSDLISVPIITALLCAVYLTVMSLLIEREAGDRETD